MWHVHFEVWRRHEEINVFATPKNDFATLEIGLCGKVISKCGKAILFEFCSYLRPKSVMGEKMT